MARISPRHVVQRVADQIVLLDERTGEEVAVPLEAAGRLFAVLPLLIDSPEPAMAGLRAVLAAERARGGLAALDGAAGLAVIREDINGVPAMTVDLNDLAEYRSRVWAVRG